MIPVKCAAPSLTLIGKVYRCSAGCENTHNLGKPASIAFDLFSEHLQASLLWDTITTV